MEIKIENMSNPPEKMRLMFEAVSQLIREQKDISSIKVQDITNRAGIGKGTAYEYFSSKEELMLNALMYEYSIKIQSLAEIAFMPELFKDRVYKVLDWIKDNKEYNQMFSKLIQTLTGTSVESDKACQEMPFVKAAKEYIMQKIQAFMDAGYRQGAFTEMDELKRSMMLLTCMVEYSFVISAPQGGMFAAMKEEDLRDFVYNSLVKSLS